MSCVVVDNQLFDHVQAYHDADGHEGQYRHRIIHGLRILSEHIPWFQVHLHLVRETKKCLVIAFSHRLLAVFEYQLNVSGVTWPWRRYDRYIQIAVVHPFRPKVTESLNLGFDVQDFDDPFVKISRQVGNIQRIEH